MSIEVKEYPRLANTPALRLAMLGWVDVFERGLGERTCNVYSNLKGLVAFAPNGKDLIPAGVMTYDHTEHNNEIFIYQSYVIPEFRGIGCYTALWNAMVAKGIELKAAKICSATSMRNSAMRAIAARQGRTEDFVYTSFNLEG